MRHIKGDGKMDLEQIVVQLMHAIAKMNATEAEKEKLKEIINTRDYNHMLSHFSFCTEVMERVSHPSFSFYLGAIIGELGKSK
jgi:hypothetical protein